MSLVASAYPSVCNAVTVESLDLESTGTSLEYLARSCLYIEVTGSGSIHRNKTVHLCILFPGGLPSTERQSGIVWRF